jgi:hypothetical protein
MNPLLIFP